MTKQALLIFTKNAVAGKVKTRLAATIGNDAALIVFNQLVEHTISVTESLPVDKFVFYSDYTELGGVWNSKNYFKQVQKGADLGERMRNAFAFAFQNGYDRSVIIGTDCPKLTTEIIMNAFAHLKKHDVVIGPAEDGGYYLIGMKHLYLELFEDVRWSTQTVFEATKNKCVRLHLDYCLLPVLTDIDEEKDLIQLKRQGYE